MKRSTVEKINCDPAPTISYVTRVVESGSHNHEIVPQANALTITERQLVADISSGPSGSHTAKSVRVMKSVNLVGMEPDRQTAYNIKRKADGRQVGEKGDLERVKEIVDEMGEGADLVVFNEEPFRVIIQTGMSRD